MAIRMTGLNSGLDTDAIITALMSAQRTKKTKIEDKKQRLEWKKEKWSSLNTKLYNFYKSSLGKMKYQSGYQTKAATSSNTQKLTATATTGASSGTYAIEIKKLAASQYVTSGQLGSNVNKSTKLKDIGMSEGTQIKIESGAKTVYFNVEAETTIKDFTSKCADAGLNATYDEKQHRFFIGSKTSGEGGKFKITASQLSSGSMTAIQSVKAATNYDALSSEDKAKVLDYTNIFLAGKGTNDTKNALKELARTGADNNAKQKVTDYYLEQAKSASALTTEEKEAINEKYKDVTDTTERDKKIKEAEEAKILEKANDLMKTTEYQDNISKALKDGLSGVCSSEADRHSTAIAATESAIASCESAATSGSSTPNDSALSLLGLAAVDGNAVAEGTAGKAGMVVIAASDSEIVFNGATLKSSDTNFSVAGINLNLLEKTEPGQTINVTVTNDKDSVYDSIKEFISEYNSILKELNTSYNAASAKSYAVLTDEQKKAMSDSEVEKWETKIKDSLLRRDPMVGNLISSMRNTMMETFTASDGKKYSLGILGISTSGDYAEGGLLHIRGDEDDAEYCDETNKLKEMLDTNPDIVAEVLTHFTAKLYEDFGNKMQSSSMSSALTFYNDKEMASQLSDYKVQIKNWESKLNKMEDKYYSQFSAMETAMAKLQQQQNSLSNYL